VSVDLGTSVDQESIPDAELQQQTSFIEGPFEPAETADQEVPVGGDSGPAGNQTLPVNASERGLYPLKRTTLAKVLLLNQRQNTSKKVCICCMCVCVCVCVLLHLISYP